LGFSFITGLADNTIQHIAYAGPLPFSGLSGNGAPSAGASLLFAQNGTIEINRTAPDGSLLSSESKSAGSDFVANFGYSERIGQTTISADETSYGIEHFLGVGGKFIRSTLVEEYSAETFTSDLGYMIHSPELGLGLGLSALNVGGRLRYSQESEALPTTLRSGLSYKGNVRGLSSLTLAADMEYHVWEKIWRSEVGVELFPDPNYGLRAGYQFLRDSAAGLTIGFGLRWQSRFMLDYAWAMSGTLNDSHRFTVSYRFGEIPESEHYTPRRHSSEEFRNSENIENLRQIKPAAEPRGSTEPYPAPRLLKAKPEEQGAPGWIY
jgi:hypothetical protein